MRTDVEYLRPDTLDKALEFLGRHGKETKVVAGGTDVMVGLRSGTAQALYLLDVSRLSELKGIEETSDELFIGAGATISDILSSDAVARIAPALRKASFRFASKQIRNMATIGGNICRASPAGDTLPALYVQDAQLELVSSSSSRRISLSEFIVGPGETRLGSGEVLRGLRLKKVPGFRVHVFEKVGNRKALAVSIVSLAALFHVTGAGVIERAHLAWGSVAPTVVRSTHVEQFLIGKPLTAGTLELAFPLVQEAISPINDIRASAAYRRSVATGLLFRLLDYYKINA